MSDLHHLRELSERATKGDWHSERDAWVSGPERKGLIADCGPSYGNACSENKANAAFIVAAVNYVREMLAKTPSAVDGGAS